jgi:hypothetical protein
LEVDAARRVGQGIDFQVAEADALRWPEGQQVRLRDGNGQLIAVGIFDAERMTVHPQVVIVSA